MDNKTINMNDDEVEIDLLQLFRALKKRILWIVGAGVIMGGRLRSVQQVCYYPAVYLDFNGIYSFKRNYTDIFS